MSVLLPPLEIDLSLTGPQNLIKLINRDNASAIGLDDVTLGLPRDFDDPFDINQRNTQVDVTSLPGRPYQGTYTFRYWRRALDSYTEDLEVDLDQLTADGVPCDTIADIKAYVIKEVGLIGEEVYFTTDTMPEFTWDQPDPEIFLAANLGSYVYTGSLKVTLIKDSRFDLGDLEDPDLGGGVIIP